ncbi:MAG: hypothetical protein M1838_005714 [Thelocarpon superellum]|nr:MAG: hypothetical protein M1838_005715 [Thelocarpon superellum]KAI9831708.1 MAG: hypothetical protein M1838_005714 [Thelocarpon superellum]
MKLEFLIAMVVSLSGLRVTASPLSDGGITIATSTPEVILDESEPIADERNKYFHEPGEEDNLHHYDQRFFSGIVSNETREETLRHMIRSYLSTMEESGLETWIAHGTLLGWWWNGKMLPWDWDIDVQVAGPTLDYMRLNMNATRHHYDPLDGQARREYYLDVNPWAAFRDRGDGMNIIDARWIDMSNGLFIDITGLSETHPDTDPGLLSCKNFHHYWTRDLYPLRKSTYEGVPVNIPYAYDRILMDEYERKALFVTEYLG